MKSIMMWEWVLMFVRVGLGREDEEGNGKHFKERRAEKE
jgi:hypothetical protein